MILFSSSVYFIDYGPCYTNKGTVTINEEELQPLLQEKELAFPKGIIGQRVKIISHEKLRQEQAKAALFQQIAEDGEEINVEF